MPIKRDSDSLTIHRTASKCYRSRPKNWLCTRSCGQCLNQLLWPSLLLFIVMDIVQVQTVSVTSFPSPYAGMNESTQHSPSIHLHLGWPAKTSNTVTFVV